MAPACSAHSTVLCLSLSALSLCVLSCSVGLPQEHGVYHTPRETASWTRNLRETDAPPLPRRKLQRDSPPPRPRRRLLSLTEWEISSGGSVRPAPVIPPCARTPALLMQENRLPLVDLSNGLGISAWNASTVETACQTWRGVCCNGLGQVQSIATAGLNASGMVLESISWLTAVTELLLEQVQLNQTLPSILGAMTQLRVLSFAETSSTTEYFQDLVWLETLTSLQVLNLANTGLRGFLPDQLLSIRGLQSLDVSRSTLDVFPCWMSQLQTLQRLDAHEAHIYGTIPLELATMSSLTHLDLASNTLFGDLHPSLFDLTNLTFFDVSNNYLQSPIPPTVGQPVNLTYLSLRNNSLTGTIPSSINNLTGLQTLQLSQNFLELPLPILSGLLSLQLLNLSSNNFTGPWPLEDMAAASSLQYLSISDNNITGRSRPRQIATTSPIFPNLKGIWVDNTKSPGDIGIFAQTTTLQFLGLSNNLFNGSVPSSFSKLTNLVELDIAHNLISGPFPAFLFDIAALKLIDITYNAFSGPLPADALAKWPSSELYISHNSFSGDLPDTVSGLTQLEVFDISFNSFTGPQDLTPMLSGLQNARGIYINNNQFSGPWPGFSNQNALLSLNLANNSFSGAVPPTWRFLTVLTGLFLSNNGGFAGRSVSAGTSVLSSLQALFCDGNQFTGQLPDVFDNMKNLQYLSFANNQLGGTIPTSLCQLNNLKFINLSNNTLSGTISACLYLMPQMQVLDLSSNYLSGNWENRYITFDVQKTGILDISNNFIFGNPPTFFNTSDVGCDSPGDGDQQPVSNRLFPIPGVTMVYQQSSSMAGNCIQVPDTTPCKVKQLIGQGRPVDQCMSFCTTTGSNQCGSRTGGCTRKDLTLDATSTADFQCNCTQGLVEVKTPDGSSTCGVYSNSLTPGAIAGIAVGCVSIVAAVLLLWVCLDQRRKWRTNQRWKNLDVCTQFTLSRVQKATNNWAQDNIVGEGSYGTVYKGCPGSTSGVREEWAVKRAKLMTNEFENEVRAMASLHHKNLVRLIGFCADYNSSTGVQEQILIYEFCVNGDLGLHLYDRRKIAPLTLDTRLHIAIGAAEGIAYLHSFEPPVIHRDIKPENILLNDVFEAKVADFGLAKKMESVAKATKVAGTPGYVDPEYNKTKVVTTKTDVYSFGIVLLEMITGKHPLIRVSKDENEPMVHIVHWVRPRFEDWNGDALADPLLLAPSEAILELTLLAIDCVRCPAMARPDMQDIVQRLKGIRAKYEGLLDDVVYSPDNSSVIGSDCSAAGSGHVGPVRVGSVGYIKGPGSVQAASAVQLPGSQGNGAGAAQPEEHQMHGLLDDNLELRQHGTTPGHQQVTSGDLLSQLCGTPQRSGTQHDTEEAFLAEKFESVSRATRSQGDHSSSQGSDAV